MAIDTEALLRESGWVRALARNLAVDAQRAEDLAQDTWVAALQGRRADGVPLRRWLAAVMRNLSRQERRGTLRRTAREEHAARVDADSSEPAPDVLARLEGHRAVVEAVMGLAEPYRESIVLRYFDGLAPRAIAQRQGLPVRTVHTQLARALVQLRGRLERRHGGSSGAWLPILGLLMGAERPGGLLGATLGAVLMDMKVKVAVGAVALAGLAFVARPLWRGPIPLEDSRPVLASASEPVGPIAEETAPADLSTETIAQRESVAVAAETLAPAEPPAANLLRARAIDTQSRAVAGLAVRCRVGGGEQGPLVHSDDAGLLELPCEGARAQLEVVDERWILVREPFEWLRGEDATNELLVAPRLRLSGRVIEAGGAPIPGAQVRIFLPMTTYTGLPDAPVASRTRTWTTESDADGVFGFEAGLLPGGMLVVRRAGYRTELREQPGESTSDLLVELATLDLEPDILSGHVIDERGYPVEGARVGLGYQSTHTDAAGRFLIGTRDRDAIGVLTALKSGMLPARLERTGDSNSAPEAWPDPLILQLGGPPLALAGRVLDAAGEPVAGAKLRLLDPTHFGAVEWENVEGITMQGFVEPLLAGQVSRLEVESDADGAFRMEGLLPRAYSLAVLHEPSMAHFDSGPLEAGASNVILRLPGQARWPRLAGRVLSLSGEPVAGASVMLVAGFLALPRVHGEGQPFSEPIYGPSTTSDAEGRFGFEDVPTSVTGLQIGGADLGLWNTHALSPGSDIEHIELRVARSCRLEVDLTGSDLLADSLALLDADGERLALGMSYGDLLFSGVEAMLSEGRSEGVTASELARTLVLYSGHVEVLRLPVSLKPGELNLIRP